MRRMLQMVSAVLALGLLVSGCYGPFNLTQRLYQWNGQFADKWEKEIVFVLIAWVPVYGLAVAGDAIVFNSMEFWTGKNPVDAPARRSDLPQVKRISRGDEEAVLTYTPSADGASLTVQQFQRGRPAGSVRIDQRDGMTEGRDQSGALLVTAQTTQDGGMIVRNGQGKSVAAYSAADVERVLNEARR